MRSTLKALGLAAMLATGLASSAWADGFKSYLMCGGSTFATCAAVQINVIGQNVTVRVWNLSGNSAATYGTTTYAGSIFRGIGFYNVSGVGVVSNSLSVSGPAYGSTTPGQWSLSNGGTNVFAVVFKTNTSPAPGFTNGIASGCATAGQLPSSTNLYANPCTADLGNTSNYVTFSFQITGTWDPNTSDLSIRYGNGPGRLNGECWTGPTTGVAAANCTTVTPEPVTMSLLATGLAGMGGAGFIRRRKQKQQSA
jgi:hypothetical protein